MSDERIENEEAEMLILSAGRPSISSRDMRQQTRRNTVFWTALSYIVTADSMKRSLSTDSAEAGLAVEDIEPRAVHNTEINERVERGIEVTREFPEEDDSVDDDEIDAWEADLRALEEAGGF
jgi:hypothetical protein